MYAPEYGHLCFDCEHFFSGYDRGVLVVRHAKRLGVAVYLRRGVEYH